MNLALELDAMLADIAQAVEDARAFQHEHGLVDVSTRKLPSAVLHHLERWRQRNREQPPNDDLHCSQVAPTRHRNSGQPHGRQAVTPSDR